ncbi:hypothetical protein QBC39DRAFT_92674 [Podospora conica]|nr:hypothetical protein QBC39DRAFT_92674 [Schizothecium conicum]
MLGHVLLSESPWSDPARSRVQTRPFHRHQSRHDCFQYRGDSRMRWRQTRQTGNQSMWNISSSARIDAVSPPLPLAACSEKAPKDPCRGRPIMDMDMDLAARESESPNQVVHLFGLGSCTALKEGSRPRRPCPERSGARDPVHRGPEARFSAMQSPPNRRPPMVVCWPRSRPFPSPTVPPSASAAEMMGGWKLGSNPTTVPRVRPFISSHCVCLGYPATQLHRHSTVQQHPAVVGDAFVPQPGRCRPPTTSRLGAWRQHYSTHTPTHPQQDGGSGG